MKVTAMTIRPVQPNDRDEWFRMRDSLWMGSPDDHIQEIEVFFVTPQDGTTFVVERPDGGLCGFIEIRLRNYAEGCISSPVPYIEGWYVDKDMRRSKLGSRLVQAAEEWARSQGYSEMASDTQLENKVSQQAHQALGYQKVERIVCFRKDL